MNDTDETVRIFDGIGNTLNDGGMNIKIFDRTILVDSGQIIIFHTDTQAMEEKRSVVWGPEKLTAENLLKALNQCRYDFMFEGADLPAFLRRQAE